MKNSTELFNDELKRRCESFLSDHIKYVFKVLKPVNTQFKFFESSPKIFAKFNDANKGDI